MASLPIVLWNQQWIAPTFPEDQTIPFVDLRTSTFREATEGHNIEKFDLLGSDVRELAKSFKNILEWPNKGILQRSSHHSVNLLYASKTLKFLYFLTNVISISSTLKSGPVSVLLPFLEGPQIGPVPEGFRMQELRTRIAKNWS